MTSGWILFRRKSLTDIPTFLTNICKEPYNHKRFCSKKCQIFPIQFVHVKSETLIWSSRHPDRIKLKLRSHWSEANANATAISLENEKQHIFQRKLFLFSLKIKHQNIYIRWVWTSYRSNLKYIPGDDCIMP